MSDQRRDWDRELADIDRLVAKQTGAPAGGTAAPAARPVPPGLVPARRHVALTWFWVALALGLSLALVIWPYQRACGLQLFFYLGAVGVTGLVGLLGALASWSHRRGFAHVLSLLVILWAGVVGLREALPRVGYAKASRTWMCEAAPVPATSGTPGSAAPAPSAPAQPSATPPSQRPAAPTP
jgi:hypothetical protein